MAYAPEAIGFDGSTNWLDRGTDLAGSADSKVGLFSAWVRLDDGDGVRQFLYSNQSSFFFAEREAAGNFVVRGLNVGGSTVLALRTTQTYLASSAWIHLLASWDLAAGAAEFYVNDEDKTLGSVLTDDEVGWSRPGWWIGISSGESLGLQGRVADLFLANERLVLATEANRRKFISADGNPVSLGSDGSTPTGNAPIIYMRQGHPNEGTNAGTGGDFDKNGTFSRVRGPIVPSVAEDLITHLGDEGVSETAGTDLFEGPPRELPANLVALTHFGGESAEDRIMGSSLTIPGVEISLVQLFVRNQVMATAKKKADEYHALLDGFDGTISGRKYFNIESTDSQPYSIGQDARELWRYVCNFRVQHGR